MKQKILLLAILSVLGLVEPKAEKPNFLVILVDDMGWMDLKVQGSSFYETPEVDKIAQEGVRFLNGYAAHPVCSPSRGALMSGKNPARLRITQWIGGSENGTSYERQLPLSEKTVAEALKESGYSTAFFGKWHLGKNKTHWPDKQGFDDIFGVNDKGQPTNSNYFEPYGIEGLEQAPDGEYLTDRLAKEVIGWIDNNKQGPFFAYLSFYTIHTPLSAKQNTINYFNAKKSTLYGGSNRPADQILPRSGSANKRQDHSKLASMVKHMDENVGRILDTLKALGIDSNTVVLFTTDNGGLSTALGNPGSNYPLKAGKGWMYEGGIRVPFIVRWPGTIAPNVNSQDVVVGMDVYPTLLDLAGVSLQKEQHKDGKSIKPILLESGSSGRRVTVFHYPHNHGGNTGVIPSSAIRLGDYKLIEWLTLGTYELYNLKEDEKEESNRAQQEPVMAQLLRWEMFHYLDTVNANLPTGVPISPPNKPVIYGCTDYKADNYNVYATAQGDSTCDFPTSVTKESVILPRVTYDPNSGNIQLDALHRFEGKVELYNSWGKLMGAWNLNPDMRTLQIKLLDNGQSAEEYSKGIYWIKITQKSSKTPNIEAKPIIIF